MAGTTPPLSSHVANLKRSVMRDLLHLAVDPEIISMASGLPSSEFIPIEELRECLEAVLNRDGSRALQYSPQLGDLRAWIAEFVGERGISCTPEEVFITGGAQQAMAILSTLFLEPGMPAVIEEPTFTGVMQVTHGRGAAVRTVPVGTEEGIDIDALEAAFRTSPPPGLAVIIPNFHNPVGICHPVETRARLAALSAEHQVLLIEDDPYGPMRFSGEHLPAIRSFDEASTVCYVGSFSKMLAPAMRLGWIVAPLDLMPRITVLREAMDLESSTLLQRTVLEFLTRGSLPRHLERINEAHGQQCRVLLEALEEHLGDLARWSQPEGGVFVWVRLPEHVDAGELLGDAIANKVAYIPGPVFSPEGANRHALRLSFGNLAPDRIREGVARLAEVIQARI